MKNLLFILPLVTILAACSTESAPTVAQFEKLLVQGKEGKPGVDKTKVTELACSRVAENTFMCNVTYTGTQTAMEKTVKGGVISFGYVEKPVVDKTLALKVVVTETGLVPVRH